MKKKIIFGLLTLLFLVNVVSADETCDISKEEAKNILIFRNYEVNEEDEKYINISIMLPSDKVYIVILNDYEEEIKKYSYTDADENGLITISSPNIYKNITYTIKSYTTDENCDIEPIETYVIDTGIYNRYSKEEICVSGTYIDACQSYLTKEEIDKYLNGDENISIDEFMTIVNKEYDKNNMSNKDKVIEFIKTNYLYVLIPFVVLSLFFGIKIFIVKRGQKIKNEK